MDIAAVAESTQPLSTETMACSEKLLALAEKLREPLRLPAGIAAAMRGKVFVLSVLGLAAGAWLAFFCWQSLRPGWIALLLLALVLLLPGVALYVVQYVLGGVAQLPERLDACVASLRGNMNTYRDAKFLQWTLTLFSASHFDVRPII